MRQRRPAVVDGDGPEARIKGGQLGLPGGADAFGEQRPGLR
jgi:hypothetical protein